MITASRLLFVVPAEYMLETIGCPREVEDEKSPFLTSGS